MDESAFRFFISEYEEFKKDVRLEIETLKARTSDVEYQVERFSSHLESEMGLARRDIERIETKLFGKDDDNIYGGRLGQLAEAQHKFEQKFEKKLAYASGIVAAFLIAFEVFKFLH